MSCNSAFQAVTFASQSATVSATPKCFTFCSSSRTSCKDTILFFTAEMSPPSCRNASATLSPRSFLRAMVSATQDLIALEGCESAAPWRYDTHTHTCQNIHTHTHIPT